MILTDKYLDQLEYAKEIFPFGLKEGERQYSINIKGSICIFIKVNGSNCKMGISTRCSAKVIIDREFEVRELEGFYRILTQKELK